MKANEIKMGKVYIAKVNNTLTRVKVNDIRTVPGYGLRRREGTRYDVTNLNTGKQTIFRSAAKFRSIAPDQNTELPVKPKKADPPKRRELTHTVTWEKADGTKYGVSGDFESCAELHSILWVVLNNGDITPDKLIHVASGQK